MFNAAFTEILLAGLAALLIVAAVIDVRTFTISNRLNLDGGAARAALLAVDRASAVARTSRSSSRAGAASSRLLAGAFYAGMMGGGDVKLAAALALWFPPAATVNSWSSMSIAGGVLTLGCPRLAPRRSAARAGPKFRTGSRSHSAVSRFSPNGFLTILPDV